MLLQMTGKWENEGKMKEVEGMCLSKYFSIIFSFLFSSKHFRHLTGLVELSNLWSSYKVNK